MPRPVTAHAEMRDRASSLLQGVALAAAVLATVAALALALLALLRNDTVAPPSALAWLLLIGSVCSGAAVAWTLWRQRDLASALREARLEVDALRELQTGWLWRSDSAHRLTHLRPPTAAPDADWAVEHAVGRPVWEHFGADAGAARALRSRLDCGARLDGVRARLPTGATGQQAVLLQGFALSDSRGGLAGYVGSARPLDEDAARDDEQSLLRALLLTLPVPVFVLAGSAAAPTHVQRGNAAAALWLGLEPGRLAGLPFSEFQSRLPADLRSPVARALAAADGTAPPSIDVGWDVRVRHVDDGRGPDIPPSGGAGRWVLTLVPVAQPAAAPGPEVGEHESFSYTVSHDLRAPIRVVEGFTKILKEDYGRQLDRIGNDHLDRVLGAAARMNSMIDALLALSQLSARPLSRQPVNLSQLAGFVVEDLRRQSPERTVEVHIEPGLQTHGDPTLLRMVLENLLGNAWKYSARKSDAQIWLERGMDNGQPVFTVRDNGAGFDMRFADRLFGVFQRLHSANDFPGTGVGLASVRRIVSRHGGEIWAESAVDRGSSFHFTLPAGAAGA